MKFGYTCDNPNDLIEKFEISNNRMILTLLNGKVYNIPHTKDNEDGILGLMEKQATRRMDAYNLKNLRKPSIIKSIKEKRKIKLEELEKYKIYLQNKVKFDSAPKEILFKSVVSKSYNININTLDLYSLNEIKKILNDILKFYNDEIVKCASEVSNDVIVNKIMEDIYEKRK